MEPPGLLYAVAVMMVFGTIGNDLRAETYGSSGYRNSDPDTVPFFEGTLELVSYRVTDDGSHQPHSRISFIVHPDFLILPADEGSIEILPGAIRAESILLRHKREDYVFLMSHEKMAVTMSRQELHQMINMFDQMRGKTRTEQADGPDWSVDRTGRKQIIQGYECEQWVLQSHGDKTEWHLWSTDEFVLNWGILADSRLLQRTYFSGFPLTDWLDRKQTPVRAEKFMDGELMEIHQFEQINSTRIGPDRVAIPANYQIVSFQQMLFDRMRNRQ